MGEELKKSCVSPNLKALFRFKCFKLDHMIDKGKKKQKRENERNEREAEKDWIGEDINRYRLRSSSIYRNFLMGRGRTGHSCISLEQQKFKESNVRKFKP